MVILDTDHITLLERPDSLEGLRLRRRLRESAEEPTATIVSFEEQSRGWLAYLARARNAAQMVAAFEKLHRHLRNYCGMVVLEFGIDASQHFDDLRGARIKIGVKDLQIAAIALTHDATLASRNLQDFKKVPGLRVEDWTAEEDQ